MVSYASTDLKTALQDVRAAYRLLYAYHERVRGVVKTVEEELFNSKHLEYLQFWEWNPNRWSKPKGKIKSDNWTWDCFPFHSYMSFYSRTGNDCKPKNNEALLWIMLDTDSAFSDSSIKFDQDVNPNQFDDVSSANSRCMLHLGLTVCNTDKNKLCWNDVVDWNNNIISSKKSDFKQYTESANLEDLLLEEDVKELCYKLLKQIN